jgi:phosphate transport system permease protein
MASMTVQIFNYATSAYDDWIRQAWAGALVLVTFVLTCSLLARLVTARLQRLRG